MRPHACIRDRIARRWKKRSHAIRRAGTVANWSPRTSLIASRLTTEASKILATLCPMVLYPENDRPQSTISIAEEFTLRRYPISDAPVDPRTAARLRILGPVVKPRVHRAALTPTPSRRPFLLRNGRRRTRTLQPAPRVRRRCAGRGRRRVRGAGPSRRYSPTQSPESRYRSADCSSLRNAARKARFVTSPPGR